MALSRRCAGAGAGCDVTLQLTDRDFASGSGRREVPPVARHDEDDEGLAGAWAMLGVLLVGKVLIVVAVGLMAPTMGTAGFLAAHNWSWIVLTLVLVGGPATFWYRLWRVRRKRAALLRAEWHVD